MIYTREEFEKLRKDNAAQLGANQPLRQRAVDLLTEADKNYWIHQTTWFGEPVLQLPQDLMAFQELIFRTRPDYIVEVGVAWAGSLLFYSTLMEVLGGKKIIGVDIFIPDDLRQRVQSHSHLSQRIELLQRSSVEEATFEEIKLKLGGSKKVLVHLDSNHTHEHVLKELQLYSGLVGKGSYIVCGDTIIEDMPGSHRDRQWGKGNNPKTALWEFLKTNKRFQIDTQFQDKYIFSCNPDGYLQCVSD